MILATCRLHVDPQQARLSSNRIRLILGSRLKQETICCWQFASTKWFYMCKGQATPHDTHFRKCRGNIADRSVTFPASTRRNNSVIITSKRRRFDVIMTLLLRCVPAGYTCSLIEWIRLIGFDTSGDWYVLYGIMCIHVLHLPRTNSPSVLV